MHYKYHLTIWQWTSMERWTPIEYTHFQNLLGGVSWDITPYIATLYFVFNVFQIKDLHRAVSLFYFVMRHNMKKIIEAGCFRVLIREGITAEFYWQKAKQLNLSNMYQICLLIYIQYLPLLKLLQDNPALDVQKSWQTVHPEEMTMWFATEFQQLSCNTINKTKAILYNNKPILMKIQKLDKWEKEVYWPVQDLT